ncbi:MAG: zinc-binding alcohol dehydrogenase family protein [Sporomusaceae bacterium]|nr:zinc-binding alcohol dehydrogenase family protein [Sporomusaceae bacterium]
MASEMQALVCEQPGVLRRELRPVPEPAAGQVLVRVRALGICGSDIHAFHGRQPMFSYPQVMGHEISGEVAGRGAAGFSPGQQVIVIPYRHCGRCIACRRGRTNCCGALSVMGVHRGGAMQEYVAVDADYLLAVEAIEHKTAAMLEPYAIAAHAVSRSGIRAGDQVLVAGAGAIGLGVADICRALGGEVILAETNAKRLAAAVERYGFSTCLNPLTADYAAELERLTHGDGPLIIIDATGNAVSMNSQIGRLAAGGTLVFVGLHTGEVQFDDLAFHKRETTLCGSRGATRADFRLVVDLAAAGKIRPGQLPSHEVDFFRLDQERFLQLTSPEVIKSVVLF